MPRPRLTFSNMQVLLALSGVDELCGAEIGQVTKLASGTLYPILIRFEQAGWLSSRWEDGDPAILGRPRRKYYKLTQGGHAVAKQAMGTLQAMPSVFKQFRNFIAQRVLRLYDRDGVLAAF